MPMTPRARVGIWLRRVGLAAAIVAMGVATIAVVVGLIGWLGIHRNPAERELVRFGESVRVGEPMADVRRKFMAEMRPGLSLRDSVGEVIIETPYRFGADNWYLYIVSDHGDQVTSLEYRTEDSRHAHPSGSPPDRREH
jgi:hypothetical protein